jgi:dolichol kinase
LLLQAAGVVEEVLRAAVELVAYLLHLQPFLLVRHIPLQWVLLVLLAQVLGQMQLVEQIL